MAEQEQANVKAWADKVTRDTAWLMEQVTGMQGTGKKQQNAHRAMATVQLELREKILKSMQMMKDNHPDEFPDTQIAAQRDKQQRFLRDIPKWTGTGQIESWVNEIAAFLGNNNFKLLNPGQLKNAVYMSICEKKREQISHMGGWTAAQEQDTLDEYVQRITTAFEPNLHSVSYRESFLTRRQRKDEPAAEYALEKHTLYRKGYAQYEFSVFLAEVIKGLCNPDLVRVVNQQQEEIEDVDQLQVVLNSEAAKLRSLAQHPICPQGTLSGLKVNTQSPNYVHEQAGTHPMEVNGVSGGDMVPLSVIRDIVAALQINKPSGPREEVVCYNCRGRGHLARNCTQGGNMSGVTCYNCTGRGHLARNCTQKSKQPRCNWCQKPNHQEKDCRNKAAGKPQVFQD